MNTWKDSIYFVLVEPTESANIGASARAMKNMGFKNLCLVNPPAVISDEARRLACNSLDVLDKAEVYRNLADAIRDKSIVVGVARRTGKRRGLTLPLHKGGKRIFDIARDNKVAILFGREDRGLFNNEVNECGLIFTIPANKEQPSLNLSHAVMVVAYELTMAECRDGNTGGGVRDSTAKRQRFVSHGETASLYERMSKIVTLLDYYPRGDRNLEKQIMDNLKHFIGRAGLTDWEIKMLHGICTQIERKIK